MYLQYTNIYQHFIVFTYSRFTLLNTAVFLSVKFSSNVFQIDTDLKGQLTDFLYQITTLGSILIYKN